MNRLQDEVFIQSKQLTGTINLIRIFFYTIISAGMLVLVLSIFKMLSWQMALVATGISLVYSYVRDFSITKYSNKQMTLFYDYAQTKHENLSLYLPLLEKSYQGYFLKRAALLIDGDILYLEAFRQKKKDRTDQVSIPVKYGDKFVIDRITTDKNNKSVTIDSTFAGQYYRFSIVNNKAALEAIEQAKRGGK